MEDADQEPSEFLGEPRLVLAIQVITGDPRLCGR